MLDMPTRCTYSLMARSRCCAQRQQLAFGANTTLSLRDPGQLHAGGLGLLEELCVAAAQQVAAVSALSPLQTSHPC